MGKPTDTRKNLLMILLSVGQIVGQMIGFASNMPGVDFPGKAYVGNFVHVGLYSVFSDYIARGIERIGRKRNNLWIKTLGKYYSEITIPMVTTYFILGETVIDWIPYNARDARDLYAPLLGGGLGFFYAREMKRNMRPVQKPTS